MAAQEGYPEPGARLGPYRLGARLGAGGMGWVFEALDTRLDRRVALKVIAPPLAGDEGFRERFVREARAQASLDSPHVVHVYDHGEVDGRLYLATQLVPDGDLGAALRAHGVPPRRTAVDLIAQVASGLADAHEAGLVHRDVKPSNVLLRRRGDTVTAYVADFGVARRAGTDPVPTSTGAAGTPPYLAPELHAGAAAGPRTDVYSLGCLLWAVLTGAPPYAGAAAHGAVTASRDRRVRRLGGDGPLADGLDRVLRTALAEDPAERYADAAGLRDDLRALLVLADRLAGRRPQRRPQRRPERRPVVAAGVVALLLALVGAGAAVGWPRAGTDADPGRRPAAVPASPSAYPAREAVAVRSLAAALAEQGMVSGARARCTARAWIAAVGLDAMVAAGYFDARLRYVDQPASAMPPRLEAAVVAAVAACAGD